MRYGMNLQLWLHELTDNALPLVEQLRQIGFDAVELPMFEMDLKQSATWGKRLDDLGLQRTGASVRRPDENPISADPQIRRKGVAANKAVLDCCQAAGIETLAGPYHSALYCFSGAPATKDEWQWAVDGMREVAEYAEQCGVNLAVEYLNRFECYLLNTAADGARFCRDVNHPRCKMMYDTFHSHIEEKNTAAAIRALKGCLTHVHISENDRGTPGQGNVRWSETFDTLKEIGYDNLLVIEAFRQAKKDMVPSSRIWRKTYENELQLAADGLRFIKAEVAAQW